MNKSEPLPLNTAQPHRPATGLPTLRELEAWFDHKFPVPSPGEWTQSAEWRAARLYYVIETWGFLREFFEQHRAELEKEIKCLAGRLAEREKLIADTLGARDRISEIKGLLLSRGSDRKKIAAIRTILNPESE